MSRHPLRSLIFSLIVCSIFGLTPACTDCETTHEEETERVEQPVPAETKPAELDIENLPDSPRVLMKTTEGDITLELDNLKAPISTKNFLQYVKDGHYNGTIFHRVMPGFMIQGGGYTEELYDNPGIRPKTTRDPIKNEASNGLSNMRGTIAMARLPQPDTATTQFFINVVDNNRSLDYPRNNGGYAVFGKVIEGMEVVDAIRNGPTKALGGGHANLPEKVVEILSVEPILD